MENDYQLLISTCPNREIADKLAYLLVEQRLAAGVNIVPAIHSIYEWQGKIVSAAEVLLLIKTRREQYAAIQQTILQHHPYQVPELIAIPIVTGSPNYLAWIDSIVSQSYS
ncbi:MAG: divalent-cation tolerance protein CutA [Beggiatoa sp. IS2]|nr:MAG: divalent-cation tolerance protein CutA [Beggiatoa sp. IS2]